MLHSPDTDDLTSLKALFVYGNISTHKILHDEQVTFFSQMDTKKEFINFGYVGDDPAFKPTIQAKGGWKLHISIDDKDPENIARVWDIIKDVLMEQRIAESKIIKPKVSFAHDPIQCGKQVTVYQFLNPNRDWMAIINEIESLLLSTNILPGQLSPTDKQIISSKYISYRNDLSKDNQRTIDSKEVMRFPKNIRYIPIILRFSGFWLVLFHPTKRLNFENRTTITGNLIVS